MHEHHLHVVLLGNPDQLHGGAAASVNERLFGWPNQILIRVARSVRHDHRPFLAEHAGYHSRHHVFHGFLGKRNVRVDLSQPLIKLRVEGMLDQPLHGARIGGQIVGEDGIQWQVRRHNQLAGKRHGGTGEVVGLHQRMGDKAGLGATRAVSVTKHDHRQIVIPNEAGHPIVDRRHGEERACTLLRLHAAGGDEADDRQVLLGTFHQQLAEFLGTRHVERAGLEIHIRDQDAGPDAAVADVEITDTGDHAARRVVVCQRLLDRHPEAREAARIGTQQVGDSAPRNSSRSGR